MAREGVELILDGAEIANVVAPMPSIDLFPGSLPALVRALAIGKVRYVGEPVAMVVAATAQMAQAAAAAVKVEYEDLPVVLDAQAATDKKRATAV